MPDGSVVVVEMLGERVTRVHPDGTTDARVRGQGRAERPGRRARRRALPVQQRRVLHAASSSAACCVPGPFDLDRYTGGLIQRIDHDGTVTNLYTELRRSSAAGAERPRDGRPRRLLLHRLRHPRPRRPHRRPQRRLLRPLRRLRRSTRWPTPCSSPNGIGLSPDGTIAVLRRDLHGPGLPPHDRRAGRARTAVESSTTRAALLCGLPGMQLLDSLAVDADGWVAVGTLINGAITSISPDGVVGRAACRPATR